MKKFLVLSFILIICYWGREWILGWNDSEDENAQNHTEIVEEKKPSETPDIDEIPPIKEKESPRTKDLPKSKLEIPEADIDLEELIDFALSLEGSPYKASGNTPDGFDCSGYIGYVYREVGIKLPRSSAALAMYGKRMDYQDIAPGDLLFFTGSNMGSGQIGHVGLVLEGKEGEVRMIHASTKRGIVIDDVEEMQYFKDRYITATRPYEKKSR